MVDEVGLVKNSPYDSDVGRLELHRGDDILVLERDCD